MLLKQTVPTLPRSNAKNVVREQAREPNRLPASADPDEAGAASVDYLRVLGHLVFGYLWARMAQVALREIEAGNTDPFYQAKLQTARFYFAKLLPETATLMRTARAGRRARHVTSRLYGDVMCYDVDMRTTTITVRADARPGGT